MMPSLFEEIAQQMVEMREKALIDAVVGYMESFERFPTAVNMVVDMESRGGEQLHLVVKALALGPRDRVRPNCELYDLTRVPPSVVAVLLGHLGRDKREIVEANMRHDLDCGWQGAAPENDDEKIERLLTRVPPPNLVEALVTEFEQNVYIQGYDSDNFPAHKAARAWLFSGR